MNNSDQHDEQLAAYIDGRMTTAEAAAFEREHPTAITGKADASRLRDALRAHSEAPALANGEFFNLQILRQITVAPARETTVLFPLWRLAFAGACCLLAVLGIFKAFVPADPERPQYFAEVLNVRTGDPSLKVRLIQEEGITIVMVDGLDAISEDYVLN